MSPVPEGAATSPAPSGNPAPEMVKILVKTVARGVRDRGGGPILSV
ncbi:hypothetical protein GCM10009678_60850 [Actinomadura kijaniata]|uniref:Uncharacterized protein n=1 Tax=Actinomadura namibiensis TaxID=182080 RepID=A0A7W3LHV2_ACTNM|nr:hypothetical protein [Actinomadura namibiensis]